MTMWRVIQLLVDAQAELNATDKDDNTPLYWAAMKNHSAVAKFLVEQGAAVNVINGEKYTPLHWAAYYGNVEVIKLLLAKNADVSVISVSGFTALGMAEEQNQDEAIKLLLEKNLHSVVCTGNTDEIKPLWEEKKVNFNAVTEDGCTLVHKAAAHNQVETLGYLRLTCGMDVNATDNNGNTPLHWAATQGHIAAMKLLLDAGVDINAKTNVGSTALHLAAMGGHINAINFLIENGAEINAPDNNGGTPLYWASIRDHAESMRCLINQGADVKALQSSLIDAVCNGNIPKIKSLVAGGVKVNEPGTIILHAAAGHNQAATIEYLLSACKMDVNVINRQQRMPLHVAADHGCIEAVQCLLQHNASINAQDEMGYTALHWALRMSDDEGKPILDPEAKKKRLAVTKLLMQNGAKVNIKNKAGELPLHLAACFDFASTVQYCLDQDIDNINAQDNSGRTALHYAAMNSYIEIVQLLLGNKAKYTIQDKEGKTAEQVAQRYNRQAVLECFSTAATQPVSVARSSVAHFSPPRARPQATAQQSQSAVSPPAEKHHCPSC